MTTRRKFSGNFKAHVALEALRGDKTIQEIASKHKVHPNQVGKWKRQAMDGLGLYARTHHIGILQAPRFHHPIACILPGSHSWGSKFSSMVRQPYSSRLTPPDSPCNYDSYFTVIITHLFHLY